MSHIVYTLQRPKSLDHARGLPRSSCRAFRSTGTALNAHTPHSPVSTKTIGEEAPVTATALNGGGEVGTASPSELAARIATMAAAHRGEQLSPPAQRVPASFASSILRSHPPMSRLP